MPLEAPQLDDRTYKDIIAEATALIPRYAPEWTNHNPSDPGITLLQLFAWMSDIMIYRLNRVPERNYIKFLQLLGIELQPARPATAELTFTLARNDVDNVIVPKGTQVACQEPDEEGNQIVFETDEALVALGAVLAAVQVFDGFAYRNETTANATSGQTFFPFGAYARPNSALLLGFDSPLAFTKEQINLTILLHEAVSALGTGCSLQLELLPPPALLVWEYWNGAQWLALSLDKDETQALALSGHVYVRGPGVKAVKAVLGKVADSLYWLRCRLAESHYERAPQVDAILINTVRATQAVTVRDEVLGGSSGRPNQSFRLASTPVVPLLRPETVAGAGGAPVTLTDLRLEVSERPVIGVDLGFQPWQQMDDFFASGPDDPHYTLNRTTGQVVFGDGIHGRIPVANPTNPAGNIVARLYRSGGGSKGNVGAGTITQVQSFVPLLDEVTNLQSAAGGSDEETVAEAKQRAPQLLKSRNRAVTAEDFEYLAEQTPGVRVKRAKALPLVHPQFPGVAIPGVVTVIVVPDSDQPNPTPNQRTLEAVCLCLNQSRLLTTEVCVIPPAYRLVKVKANLIVLPQSDQGEVKTAVENALTTYFHPLTGGDEKLGWEFGGTIFYSNVYQVILQTPGVGRIDNNQLELFLDGEAQPFCRDVPLEPGELLYSEGHEISVQYAR